MFETDGKPLEVFGSELLDTIGKLLAVLNPEFLTDDELLATLSPEQLHTNGKPLAGLSLELETDGEPLAAFSPKFLDTNGKPLAGLNCEFEPLAALSTALLDTDDELLAAFGPELLDTNGKPLANLSLKLLDNDSESPEVLRSKLVDAESLVHDANDDPPTTLSLVALLATIIPELLGAVNKPKSFNEPPPTFGPEADDELLATTGPELLGAVNEPTSLDGDNKLSTAFGPEILHAADDESVATFGPEKLDAITEPLPLDAENVSLTTIGPVLSDADAKPLPTFSPEILHTVPELQEILGLLYLGPTALKL